MSQEDHESQNTVAPGAAGRELARYRALVHEQLSESAIFCVSADAASLLVVEGAGLLPHPRSDEPARAWLEDYVHPEDHEVVRAAWAAAIDDPGPFALEHRVRRADGSWFWVSARVSPVRDQHGELVEWVGQATDISARRAAEATLRRRETQFRALIQAAANSIFRMSADGSELRQVQGGGFIPDAVEPVGDWAWLPASVPPDEYERVRGAINEALAAGGVFDLEHQVYRLDGSVGWAHSRSVPVRDDGGRIVEWFGAVSDITERKRAEMALQELMETLEARVEARTAEVRDLGRRLTMAEQEERRRIAQILHDDLQQLLYGIQLKMSMMRRDYAGAWDPAVMGRVGEAEAWLEQAIDLTRQLSVDLSPPVLKLEGLTDALRWLQREIQRLHGLEVIIEAESACRVPDEGLRVLLFQILRELLFNVNKHAGVSRAWVRLLPESGRLVIDVIDEGRGFDVAAVDPTQHGGFGLTSVRERLSLVGGHLDIRSAPGSGTRVRIEVPLGGR